MWLKINAVAAEDVGLSHGYDRSLQEVSNAMRAQFEAYSEWAAAEFALGRRAAELCLGLLENRQPVIRELADEAPLLCFCRADARFANVIQRPNGQVGLVDWEGSGRRDPATELADILSHPNQEDLLSADEWQAFLRPYLAGHNGSDAGLMQRAQLYLALFPIYFMSVIMKQGLNLAQRGQLPGWSVNELPANLRLRRYLARALAWPSLAFERELDDLAETAFFPAG